MTTYEVMVPIAGYVCVQFEYDGEPKKSTGLEDCTDFENLAIGEANDALSLMDTKKLEANKDVLDYSFEAVVAYSRGNMSLVEDIHELDVVDFY